MRFVVDRIEEEIVILESLETKDIIEAEKDALPKEVHEGSVLVYENEEFKMDEETENKRREDLMRRLERLKKLKK